MAGISPKILQKGDLIKIVSTARFVENDFIDHAVKTLTDYGFRVETGENLFARQNQFAGSDEEKLSDINNAIRNPDCRAILCARGGYGSARILDKFDLASLKKDPKWIAGYSDITAILNHLFMNADMEGLHSTMPVNFKSNTPESLESLVNALTGKTLSYRAPQHLLNRSGNASGEMIGGNLSMLFSLQGSNTQLNTDGKILFLEDLDEYLYHIDRMMVALKRAGMLENLAGLIIGGMTDMNDNEVPFGKNAEEIISEHIAEFDFPVCYNFPSGHIDNNCTWIHGKKIRLTVINDQPSEVLF